MPSTTPTATTEVLAKTSAPSLWSPLALPIFRMLWIALLTENICSWLLDVTNGWLMTSLSSSPVMVSLVQTAALLPILFFALPSGALTDILNRRSILLWTEASLCVVSAILAALVYLKVLTGPLLLFLIFTNGTGLAFSMPVWQTVAAEIVPVAQQPVAYVLGGLAVNMARGLGPVLAGVFLASAGGAALSFAASSIGFALAFLTVRTWPATLSTAAYLPTERVFAAIFGGIRYVRYD